VSKQDRIAEAALLVQRATAWQRDGQTGRAEQAYQKALSLDPTNADAMSLLGLIHHKVGERDLAIRLIRSAIKLQPAARHYYNLGVVLEMLGDQAGTVAAYRQAVALDPSDVSAWAASIFMGDLHPYSTPEVRLADRRAFNARHCAALTTAAAPHRNNRDVDRRLRIGYLSADFRNHSASAVFLPVLLGHDHDQVEVYGYWQRQADPDTQTQQIQALTDHWREVQDLTDSELAQQIRADQIDILVDLSGYSNGNRLLALARKPAPIIMTGWGHVTGLGIDACDYILADAVTIPPEHASQHHERVLHLPSTLAFAPCLPDLDVAPPPADANGYVTFGYFGRVGKVSDVVWSAWAAILHRVPGSRLLLKGAEYADASYRAQVVDIFTSLRVNADRLGFLPTTARAAHLESYGRVDIALDPFPQTGGVTTLEATLMGVPTATLLGDYLNARIGASIMHMLDRGQWVALDVQHYIELAVLMAHSRQTLADRQALRDDLLGSIICKPREYARAVEDVYRQAWREWCSAGEEKVWQHGEPIPVPFERRLSLVGAS
jgi:predicted O-linked N-acetylglucosamine transferase (SPINDLY family)